MISNIYSSYFIVSTKQCLICEKGFLFGELIVRHKNFDKKNCVYYHSTCFPCVKCKKAFLKTDQNFFNMIYYSGNICRDEILCDQCKEENK
jgi:hypothetical protein